VIAKGATVVWLVVVWLVVVESVTPGAVLAGAFVAAVLMVVFRPPTRDEGRVRIRPLALARYVGRFLVDLVHANVLVAWAVIAPARAGVRQGIVAVPVAPMPDSATMVLANAISLTPGTFIVEIRHDPTVFYLHVLQLGSVDEVRRTMWLLQRRLARGLGLDGATATIDGWLALLDAVGTDRAPGPSSGGGER
jgi:multicomponent Na+:H+ antiporter subunit E